MQVVFCPKKKKSSILLNLLCVWILFYSLFLCLDFVLFIIFVFGFCFIHHFCHLSQRTKTVGTVDPCNRRWCYTDTCLHTELDSCFITIMGCAGSATRCCRRPSRPWRGSCLRRVNPLKTRWRTSSTPSPSPWASFTESLTCSPTNGLCFSLIELSVSDFAYFILCCICAFHWLNLFLILHILFYVVSSSSLFSDCPNYVPFDGVSEFGYLQLFPFEAPELFCKSLAAWGQWCVCALFCIISLCCLI